MNEIKIKDRERAKPYTMCISEIHGDDRRGVVPQVFHMTLEILPMLGVKMAYIICTVLYAPGAR